MSHASCCCVYQRIEKILVFLIARQMEHNRQLNRSWDDLPQDALFFVFSYLDTVELARIVASVCRSWNAVANHNEIWRPKCLAMCLHNPLSSSNGLLFKELYTGWYKEFSRYTEVYPVIKPLFDRFQTWSKKNIPRMLGTFLPGATEKQLAEEESQIAEDFIFPKDLRCWVRLSNGQQINNDEAIGLGMFGGYSFYDHKVSLHLMSTTEILALHTVIQKKLAANNWIKHVVPLISSFNRAKIYFLVIKDLPNAPRNSIVVPTMGFKDYMPLAESFTALLEDHLDRLEGGDYKLEDDEIQIFPYRSVPEAINRGVRIKASPLLISERTQPKTGEFLWAYRIFMSMDEDHDANDSCQLVSRHWIITDGNGHVEHVEGPGVVGLYPKMTPGAFFFYESCCPLSTVSGSMEGTFKMKRKDGFEFDAQVPRFEFKIPSVIRSKRKVDAISNQDASSDDGPSAAKKQKL